MVNGLTPYWCIVFLINYLQIGTKGNLSKHKIFNTKHIYVAMIVHNTKQPTLAFFSIRLAIGTFYHSSSLNQYQKIFLMKRIITFLLALSGLVTAFAQTPQAVCYQGVATDQQGRELISQNIRVRLSILKTSASGAEEWVENHSVTTDGFGLFDLPIGLGARTGGVQTTFSNIKWGADKYYLKVEMDITGGTNYVLMGVNQLISVPYALYSDKTGVADSAVASSRSLTSITANTAITATTAITANTANYSTTSGRSVTSGRSDTATFAWLADSTRRAATANYALNSGRALTAGRSDTALFAWLADSARRAGFATNAGNANYAANAGRALTAGRSDTAQFAWLADSARRAATAGFATNAQNAVNAQTAISAQTAVNATNAINAQTAVNATNSINATNAQTANRAISSGRSDTAQFAWLADSTRRAAYAYNANRAVSSGRSDTAQFAWVADSARRAATAGFATNAQNAVNSLTAINATNAVNAQNAVNATNAVNAQQALTALDDRDRDPLNEIQSMSFDTSTSTLKLTKPNGQFDSVSFNGTPLGAPGASIDYPYGILGEAILITSNYTVPAGKTLFISAANNPIIMADGKRLNIEPGMPILPTGSVISTCFCSGILVKTEAYAVPIILDFAAVGFEYRIPMGKNFVIKSGTNDSRDMSFIIDGTNYSFYTGSSASPRLVVIPEGRLMRRGLTNVGTSFVVTGYLLNKNP